MFTAIIEKGVSDSIALIESQLRIFSFRDFNDRIIIIRFSNFDFYFWYIKDMSFTGRDECRMLKIFSITIT